MNASSPSRHEKMWTMIDAEKKKDAVVRRISIIAWSVTAAVFLVYAGLVGVEIAQGLRMLEVGILNRSQLISLMMPLVTVVGLISLLIAVLSTVGIFLRLRTSSLHEIQLRLAALEELILAKGDANSQR